MKLFTDSRLTDLKKDIILSTLKFKVSLDAYLTLRDHCRNVIVLQLSLVGQIFDFLTHVYPLLISNCFFHLDILSTFGLVGDISLQAIAVKFSSSIPLEFLHENFLQFFTGLWKISRIVRVWVTYLRPPTST